MCTLQFLGKKKIEIIKKKSECAWLLEAWNMSEKSFELNVIQNKMTVSMLIFMKISIVYVPISTTIALKVISDMDLIRCELYGQNLECKCTNFLF